MALAWIACAKYGEWHQLDETMPWASAGVQAKSFSRSVDPGFGVVAGSSSECVWQTPAGKKIQAWTFADRSARYLEQRGVLARWPASDSWDDGVEQRLAPFRFTIVAIEPLVVVQTPYDFGVPEGRSISEILGPIEGLHTKYLINVFEYGTTTPYAEQMLWFSPDLDVPPTPVRWSAAGGARFSIGPVEELDLSRESYFVKVTRVRRSA